MSLLQTIQDLYNRNRFLEAYRQSAEYWKPTTPWADLSLDELILAGRLAQRLGGHRLSRGLLRAAYARDPSNPRAQYYSSHCRRSAHGMVDFLRLLDQQPDLGGDDAEARASWFASQAMSWASLRDFARADAFLKQAQSLNTRDAWVWACESQVRGMADRWADALRAAERSWEANPGAPYGAAALGASLINLGRVEESAKRLLGASESNESYEVALVACWHLCALAETLDGEGRRDVLRRAHALGESLPTLAPLADREVQPAFAQARLDVATLMDDREQVEKCLKEVDSPFHRRVLENLQKNPGGRRTVLPFNRAIQKFDACVPASVSSALISMQVNLSADTMASEITHGGTPLWEAAEWLEARGFVVRFFAVKRAVASALIANGIAFILNTETDDSGHAVAVVGWDESAGTLIIRDPSTFRTTQYLLDGLEELKLPLGPKGMAVVPGEKAALLDSLLAKEDVDVMTASHLQQKAVTISGPSAAREIVNELAGRYPRHAGTLWMRAVQAVEDGRSSEALANFQGLLNDFPGCAYVRRGVVTASRALGNTALLREILGNVVNSARLPGIQSDQVWSHPPASYVTEYADLLRLSAPSRVESRRLLNLVIKRDAGFAMAWHTLGDLLLQQNDIPGVLLSFRLASCLATYDDHLARAYSDALRGAGREAEGLAWLESRVRSLGAASRAMGPCIAWIGALEDYGYPERALAACDDALQLHGEAPDLLAFAVPFLARMGHWEEAEKGLRQLEGSGHTPHFYQAAVDFHRMRGDLNLAIEQAEQWVRETPQSILARRQLAELIASRDGPRAAVDLTKRWLLQDPGHERLEDLYYRQLANNHGGWKSDLLLRRRLKRNTEDGWAWRELTFRRLIGYNIANQQRREELQPLITRLLAECDRTAPEAPGTLRAHAEWLEVRGEWQEAVTAWLKAIDAEPDNFYSYQRIWDCFATLNDSERRVVLQQIEGLFLGQPGRLHNACELVSLIAQRFGATVAEEAALRWIAQRGDEPELIEAAADLLLAVGHGCTDAARALAMLEPAVGRFPYYVGLRLSLGNAFRKLGKDAEAEETPREVIRRHPDHTGAHIQLAWVHNGQGNGEEALRLLEAATTRDPLNPALWDTRAGILIHNRRLIDARAMLQEGLRKMPASVPYRELAIQRFLECDDSAGAVEAAREGVKMFPLGAYTWFLLAITLNRTSGFAAPGEIESALQRSVSLNPGLFIAADTLAMFLVDGRRYEEADNLMARMLPRLSDPSLARGRQAWIHREAGRKAEALDELVAALRDAPWYRWAWALVLEWLVEDKAWDKARSLLCASPPELRTDISLRSKRLTVLEQAGLPAGEIDAEWNALLKDFPEDISLHLERYDGLRDSNRTAEAAALLEPLSSVAPGNPWMLARMVEVRAGQQKKSEAIATLLGIWFAEGEGFDWAARCGWNAGERASAGIECCQKARHRLEQGSRPNLEAFSIMVAHATRHEASKENRQPAWRAWFPGAAARDALAQLDLVRKAGGTGGDYEAAVFRSLSDCGYERLVVRMWKKGRTLAATDVQSWAEVGRALASLGRKKDGRRLLSGWRQRAGVRMWMVANYIQCIPTWRRKDWQEIRAVCQDALANLHHDHCAKYLAHLQAEMAACLGDTDAFRQTWLNQRAYFTGNLDESEWFPPQRLYLLTAIPNGGRLLEQNQPKLFKKACRGLRNRRWGLVNSPGLRTGFRGLPWWAWILLMLALQLMRLINQH